MQTQPHFVQLPTFAVYRGTPWIVGCLLISRAFHGLPPGFEDLSIDAWEEMVSTAKEINAKAM